MHVIPFLLGMVAGSVITYVVKEDSGNSYLKILEVKLQMVLVP